jgi:hypothetical protein
LNLSLLTDAISEISRWLLEVGGVLFLLIFISPFCFGFNECVLELSLSLFTLLPNFPLFRIVLFCPALFFSPFLCMAFVVVAAAVIVVGLNCSMLCASHLLFSKSDVALSFPGGDTL